MVNEIPAGDETALRAEITRLNKIVTALVNRAERETGAKQSHFGLFQNAVMLENQVRRRTAELEEALRENERINRDLTREREEQRILIKKLEEAHNQLLQSEKLASIGQLAAGVAHEINNPIGFVNSNLGALQKYCDSLLGLLDQYEGLEGELKPESSTAIRSAKKKLDLDFLRERSGDSDCRIHRRHRPGAPYRAGSARLFPYGRRRMAAGRRARGPGKHPQRGFQ